MSILEFGYERVSSQEWNYFKMLILEINSVNFSFIVEYMMLIKVFLKLNKQATPK